jgi:hypothetical protein
MKKVYLLSTAAAALLFVAGAATAQDLKKDEHPAPAPAAQQKAPAEKIAPNMHAGDRKAPETTGQAAPKAAEPEKSQALDKGGATATPNAAMKDNRANEKTQVQSNEKAGAATKSKESASEPNRATTGQGSAAGAAKLSTEQRTKISTIIRGRKTPSVQLNVSVSVGTRVPTNVHLYPLPVEVFAVYPEWRGYDYVMVGDDILVIDPRSHEIVAVIGV